ncbi:MAG: hypothetical protein N4A70_13800 [Pelagimonas sp.]|nr:hypothetical protein [Pelagimonas sp.]
MTAINKSTTDVLAAITAQNLFQRSPSQATAVVAAEPPERAMPVSSTEQKEKTSRGDPWEKNLRNRTSPGLKERMKSSPETKPSLFKDLRINDSKRNRAFS